jgi:GTP-binding protein HflX
VLLTDTVGFIRKLPHHLVASFRATLEETNEADLVLHVIDASSPTWEEQRTVVEQVLDELGAHERPKLVVFNKIDLLSEADLLAMQERVSRLVPNAVYVSTVTEGGLDPLKRALEAATRARRPVSEIRVPIGDGKTLADIHQGGEVLEQKVDGEFMVLTARIDERLVGRLKKAGARVSAPA